MVVIDKLASWLFLTLAVAGVLTAVGIGCALRSVNQSILQHAPLVDAITEIKLELTTSHLWFEEIISGDRHEKIEDVWRHLDQADWYARAMLRGGTNQSETFVALRDPDARKLLRMVQVSLAEFRTITTERWQSQESSATGSAIDQRYDAVFAETIGMADSAKSNIKQKIAADTSRYFQLLMLEIINALVLFAFVAWTVRRHVLQLAERSAALQHEIVEREQAEKSLWESDKRFMDLMITSGDAILLIDGETFVDCNEATARMLGYSNREEFLMTHPSELSPPLQPDGADSFEKASVMIKTAFEKGFHRFEWIHRKASGEDFPVEVSLTPIPYQGKTILHCLWRDITQRKRSEQQIHEYGMALENNNKVLKRLNQVAQSSSRAKSEFLANMSHEIRTPMTAILGYTELLTAEAETETVPPQRLRSLKTIKRNGDYLLELINDILDLSKIESGKLEIEQIECSPRQILTDTISLMKVRSEAAGIDLKFEFDGPIPEHIQTDPTRLRQILINIIGNAIKFTEAGGVRVVVRLLDTDSDNPTLQFDVVDTGIGMTEEQIKKLFQPFVQADTSTTRKFGGTGLGLTISKRLTENLGGVIRVSSVPGQGSTFSFSVSTGPIDGVEIIDVVDGSEASNEQTTKSNNESIRLTCRVLLAEDGPDNQRLFSYLLKKSGGDVTVAENGQIAYDLALAARAARTPFDVILMDMQMPVMDGYEATTKLRKAGFACPIIAVTAHAMSTDRNKCLDAGCDEFMTKPIDRNTLISTVARYASQERRCRPDQELCNS